jgi:TPR repeat protein
LKASAAAFGVGQTYDAAVYRQHKVAGLQPDNTLAAEWYGKAAAAGHAGASAALLQLGVQP